MSRIKSAMNFFGTNEGATALAGAGIAGVGALTAMGGNSEAGAYIGAAGLGLLGAGMLAPVSYKMVDSFLDKKAITSQAKKMKNVTRKGAGRDRVNVAIEQAKARQDIKASTSWPSQAQTAEGPSRPAPSGLKSKPGNYKGRKDPRITRSTPVQTAVNAAATPTASPAAANTGKAHSAFQEALYGAGVGAVSGGALSFLQGGSILEGAMYGAGFGAGFSGAASMAGKHFNHRGKLSDKSNATWNLSQRGVSRHAPGTNGGEASKLGLRHYQMAGGIGGFLGSSNRKKNSNHLKANGWANGTHPMYFR
jgi:hypothetical protein